MLANTPSTLPKEQATNVSPRTISIGVPASADRNERIFPLTPEGAQSLVEQGFRVVIESGAAKSIHYTDSNYTRRGAQTGTRAEALGCDIVIHLPQLAASDFPAVRRGAMLLTLLNIGTITKEYVAELNRRSIIAVALDLIEDSNSNEPFADILNEIAGRAALALACAHLADSSDGKGILLGGVAGIIPCEVTVIGSGIAAIAAARSACGLGATVRMFDDDLYSLRRAVRELGPQIIPSALHSNVLAKALASADVIVLTPVSNFRPVTSAETSGLKKGVITFDLTAEPGQSFPAMQTRDAGTNRLQTITSDTRICYTHTANAVPRTAAMALSNSLISMFCHLRTHEGTANALKLSPGLQAGTLTYLGKLVNSRLAERFGCRAQDISLFIRMS